jgi:LysM repeat protein
MTPQALPNWLRTLSLALLVVLLSGALSPVLHVSAQSGSLAAVNTGNLNVRSGPSVQFSVVARVPYNGTVTLIGRADKGTWVQVRLANNMVGWVNSIYLRSYADISLLPVTYLTPAIPSPAQVVPPPGTGVVGQRVYTVRQGDTLAGIAARYGTTIASLMASNGISDPNRIYAGQQLIISYGVTGSVTGGVTTPVTGSGTIHVVAAGETLAIIAARYGTTWSAIAAANGLANANFIYSGQRLVIPGAGTTTTTTTTTTVIQPRYYTVQRGDSLFSIAQRFGTTIANLTALNSLTNPNAIKAGQTLRVA